MRRIFLSVCLVVGVCLFFAPGWAVCPEEPLDSGECDTVYVDVHPPDVQGSKDLYYFVRFPIRMTHDIVDATIDSVAGLIIPLCYTHTNPEAYCSLTDWWNTTSLNPYDPAMARSIFRDLDGESNFICDLNPFWYPPPEIQLDLDGTSHFWLSYIPTGEQDQRIPDMIRGLLATMTFRLDDSTTICIDTCFWPPSYHLAFHNSDAQTYVPRDNLPMCEAVGVNSGPPFFLECPSNESHSGNGTGFSSGSFAVETFPSGGQITEVGAEIVGSGVDNVSVVYTSAPPAERVEGYVTYDVVDHCISSNTIWVVASDEYQREGECSFGVELTNDPPALSLRDTVEAVEDVIRNIPVPATDPNDDFVETSFNALWYEPDSLQPPVNSPSFEGGNPGLFSWVPTETEEGLWICSFTATDACGAEETEQVVIVVGPLFCGDFNDNGILNLDDGTKLLTYLFKGGSAPDPLCKADVNCDGLVEIGDVIRILNYLFRAGPAPCFDCCAE